MDLTLKEKHPAPLRAPDAFRLRDFRHLRGVRPLGALANFECDFVAFVKIIESHLNEVIGVEEKIFLHTLDFDESEAFLIKTDDSSFFHRIDNAVHLITIKCRELKREVDELVALCVPKGWFGAIGAFYESFPQVSDDEVISLMKSPVRLQ